MKENILAITLGDPAGVGPEIVAKLVTKYSPNPSECVVFVGCEWSIQMGATSCGLTLPSINLIEHFEQARSGVNFLDIGFKKPRDFRYGKVQSDCGRIAVESVERAALACLREEISGMLPVL